MHRIIYIFAILLLFQACKPKQQIVYSTRVDSVYTDRIITKTDTALKVVADSSLYQAWVDCDSTGKATVKELNTILQGKRSRLGNITITPLDKRNVLTFDCQCDSLAIYLEMVKYYEKTTQSTKSSETVPVEVNVLTWWQQTQIYGFRVLGIIFLILIIIKYIKTWLNPTSLIR